MVSLRQRCGVFPFVLAILSAPRIVSAQAADPVKERLEKSPRHQEWATIDAADGRKVKAFVVFPEVDRKVPAIIVIHENKGLTDWVRGVADQIAEAGYVAIAPDLLSGTGPGGGDTDSFASVDAATKGIYSLKDPQVMADLDAVAGYAKTLDAANGKIATIGFCWGGGQSFAYAAHNIDLAAALVRHGSAPKDESLKTIMAPVYGFYGGNDQRISGKVPEVTQAMKKLGKKYEPVVYQGAGHGFMRAGEQPDAAAADRKAHDEGWVRVKKILAGL